MNFGRDYLLIHKADTQPVPFTFSLMNSHMMRVISSPSISTTGWSTLIRCVASETFTVTLTIMFTALLTAVAGR